MKLLQTTALASLALLLVSAPERISAQSQDMKAMAQQFGQSAKANASALRMYSWTTRVSVTLKDDPKPAKLFTMRFDSSGVVQKTALNPEPPKEQGRGLKGRVVANKTAEFKEWADDLVELCKGYLVPTPALLQAFFARVLTAPAPGGFQQLYAEDVISPGDKLTYEIDPKTQALNRVLFHATLDKDPIDGVVQFASIPGGGPSYAAKATVNAPAKKLIATLENFQYVRN